MLLDVVGRIHVLYTGIVLSSSHWCRVWCYRGCTVAGAIRDMLNTSKKRSKVKEIIVLIKARSFLDELNLEHLTS